MKTFCLYEAENLIVYRINDTVLQIYPHVDVFGGEVVNFVLDSGAQCSVISERIYCELLKAGIKSMELPVQNVVLRNAFGGRTRRIRKQAYLEIKLREDTFEHIFFISPQLESCGIL
jgi:hypothetical protein